MLRQGTLYYWPSTLTFGTKRVRAPPAHPRRVQRDRRCSLAFGLLTILPSRRSVPISSERASSNLREAPPLACKIELEHGSRKPLDRDITEMCPLGTGTS